MVKPEKRTRGGPVEGQWKVELMQSCHAYTSTHVSRRLQISARQSAANSTYTLSSSVAIEDAAIGVTAKNLRRAVSSGQRFAFRLTSAQLAWAVGAVATTGISSP